MRLQEIYHICQNVSEHLAEPVFEEKKGTGNVPYFKLVNSEIIRNILDELSPITSLNKIINSIINTSVGFEQSEMPINFDQRNRNIFFAEYRELVNRVHTIIDLFESIDYIKEHNGFDIKLPPEMSLLELSKCTKDLNTVFSTCPLLINVDGSITFSAVDVGSIWLSFVIGGAATTSIITMIAALVDKALIIRSHYLTTKEQAERIRSLQLGNDILEEAKNLNQQIGKKLLEQTSEDLAKEHNIDDPEDLERLKHSIQLLSDWMSKGMEVYAAINAPAETKAVFPPVDKQLLTNDVIKKITAGDSDSEN